MPKQNSLGGKIRLGSISKQGDVDLRRLLVRPGMARIAWAVMVHETDFRRAPAAA